MRLGRVFVSSAFGGMMHLRDEAERAVRLLGLEPAMMEDVTALSDAVRNRLRTELEHCDTYLGLFDTRRGTVPPGVGRAITEEEFRIARELRLKRLAFVSDVPSTDRDPGLQAFLDREVTAYADGLWPRPFKTPEQLRREIAAGLAAIRPRVVLGIERDAAGEGFAARLFLGGVQPAWTGPAEIGPLPIDLRPGPALTAALGKLRAGDPLEEDRLRLAGAELFGALLPGALGEALGAILALPPGNGLISFEIRSALPEALALPWELLALPGQPPGQPLAVRAGRLEIVRRVLAPGEALAPDHDPAPTLPALHLDILGFTAAPIEDQEGGFRLGSEGGLREDADLFWEREQERLLEALDDLIRERRGRLVLPDSGDVAELTAEIVQPSSSDAGSLVVHISCHGNAEQTPAGRRPVLLLEDEDGHRAPVGADELLAALRSAESGGAPVSLLVLSACSTSGSVAGEGAGPEPGRRAATAASAATVAASEEETPDPKGAAETANRAPGLAEALVAGGARRVLGMQGPVSDRGATAFAAAFYEELARGVDLPRALAAGRRALAEHGLPGEWALPTLHVAADAGPLVAPEAAPEAPETADGAAPPVATPFEIARERFEIEGVTYLATGYVGRREAERRLARAFAREAPGGALIAIHGLGGIGKSTLAARFLERREARGARVEAMYAGRTLTPAPFFDEVAGRFGIKRADGLPPEEQERQLRGALRSALREVQPTVLYLDNFEDNQSADGDVPEALGAVLAELLTLGGRGFRLLMTTRVAPHFPGVALEAEAIDLGELSKAGCRKLRLNDPDGLGLLDGEAWRRALAHLGGHPKALELLGKYVLGRKDRAAALLAEWGPGSEYVDAKLRAEFQRRGRKLLVDEVVAGVPPARRPAFDRLCLLEVPVPTAELIELLAAEGIENPAADLAWLRDHGLLASVTGKDLVHRLVASGGQKKALGGREGADAVKGWHLRLAGHFEKRDGPLSDYGIAAHHLDAAGDRAWALDMYNTWAKSLYARQAYAAAIQVAREGLERFHSGDSERECVQRAWLLVRIFEGLERLGVLEGADRTLEAAWEVIENFTGPEALHDQGGILRHQGRRALDRGDAEEAAGLLDRAAAALEAAGMPRERAIVLGEIARLKSRQGDVSSALRLHEEELQVYEQLRDVRSRAVTLGEIARLKSDQGDVSSALRLHEEELKVYEQLGDVRSRAVTLGDIARLKSVQGDVSSALRLHEEVLEVVEQLGDVKGRAVTLGAIARLKSSQGDVSSALRLHEEALRVYEQLGDVRERAVALADIAQIEAGRGDFDKARMLQAERLEVNRGLGDVDGVASAQFDLARIDLQEKQWPSAFERLTEAWQLFNQIGRAEGIGVTGILLGQLLAWANREAAFQVFATSRDAFSRLGRVGQVQQVEELIAQVEALPAEEEGPGGME